MKLIQKFILVLTISLGLACLMPLSSANAQLFDGATKEACKGSQLSSGGANCEKQAKKADSILQRVVNLLTIIVGVVAVVMIIVNGFRFITSGGDSNAVASARNGLIYAIVGLVVVALAQVIVRFIINKL